MQKLIGDIKRFVVEVSTDAPSPTNIRMYDYLELMEGLREGKSDRTYSLNLIQGYTQQNGHYPWCCHSIIFGERVTVRDGYWHVKSPQGLIFATFGDEETHISITSGLNPGRQSSSSTVIWEHRVPVSVLHHVPEERFLCHRFTNMSHLTRPSASGN